jgi:hypothetical protein
MQQDAVDHAENRRIRSHSQGQHRHDGGSERRRLPHEAKRKDEVGEQEIHFRGFSSRQ